jgi:hypothetical protein
MSKHIKYSKRSTLKEALKSLHGFIGYWTRNKDDKERYIGYLFLLIRKLIHMAEYIRETGTDPIKIKELTSEIPRKKDLPKNWEWPKC